MVCELLHFIFSIKVEHIVLIVFIAVINPVITTKSETYRISVIQIHIYNFNPALDVLIVTLEDVVRKIGFDFQSFYRIQGSTGS